MQHCCVMQSSPVQTVSTLKSFLRVFHRQHFLRSFDVIALMSARGTSALRSMGSIDSASSHESVQNLAAAFAAAEAKPPNGVPRSPGRYPSGPVNGGVHAQATANGGAAKEQIRHSFGAAMAGELCIWLAGTL